MQNRFLVLLTLALALTACDSSQQASQPQEDQPAKEQSTATAVPAAKAVLKQYIDASIHRDYKTIYSLASEQDRSHKTLAQYIQQQKQETSPLADSFYDRIRYDIQSVTPKGDTLQAVVEYHFPDLEKMIKDTFNLQVLKPDIDHQELEKMKQELESRYHDGDMPMRSNDRQFTLVKENRQWKIRLNWK